MSDYLGPDHKVTVSIDPCWHYDADTKTWANAVHVDYDVEHPAACDALKYGELCALDHWLNNNGCDDMPNEPGVYIVSYWGTGPDHNSEYDAGLTVAPVTESVEAGA